MSTVSNDIALFQIQMIVDMIGAIYILRNIELSMFDSLEIYAKAF